MKKLSRGPIIALSSVLGLGLVGGGSAAAIALDKDTVTITADGSEKQVSTRAKTVQQLLDQQGITVSQRDVVQPALNTPIEDGAAVTVLYSRPVTLTVDGYKVTRWTTARTVDAALRQLRLDNPKNILSTNRSTTIGRQGLSLDITTLKKVEVKTAKGTKVVEVPSNATLAEALKKAGVTFAAPDVASPAITTPVSQAAAVTYQDVKHRPIIAKEELPFKTVEKEDDTLAKGTRKVVTKGVKGVRENTIRQVWVDGKRSKDQKLTSKVTRKPVDEVILVGTKEEQKPEPVKTEPKTTSKSTSSSSTSTRSSSSTSSKTSSSTSSKSISSTGSSGGSATPKAGGYSGSCEASMYWDPQPTASGEQFNPWAMTAAHKTLPMGTRLKVTNVATGKSVVVRINDRGPYIAGRCLDLAKGAFLQIAPESAGVAQVTYVQV